MGARNTERLKLLVMMPVSWVLDRRVAGKCSHRDRDRFEVLRAMHIEIAVLLGKDRRRPS